MHDTVPSDPESRFRERGDRPVGVHGREVVSRRDVHKENRSPLRQVRGGGLEEGRRLLRTRTVRASRRAGVISTLPRRRSPTSCGGASGWSRGLGLTLVDTRPSESTPRPRSSPDCIVPTVCLLYVSYSSSTMFCIFSLLRKTKSE